MNKKFCFFSLVVFCFLWSSVNAYAGDEIYINSAKTINGDYQYKQSNMVRTTGTPRGMLLSSVDIGLTNKGGGTVEIYADLLCHIPAKRITIWLYLEKWDSVAEDWSTVNYEHFEWLAEDYPDQELTMAVVSYKVSRLERGQDYRLRGMFGASALTSSLQESWTANTTNLFVD